MNNFFVPEISDDVYWVGVKDWNRRIFDALIPLPQGTSYNSYLVVGEKKIALVDTVNPGFEKELEDKIGSVTKLQDIDYVVMNHAEPDHAGAIPYIMKKNNKAILITTEKGARMASTYYKVPEKRMQIVKDEESIDLGGKTLEFIEAPWLHWPETMFTYLKEKGILFSCDYFGSHTAFGFYDEDVHELIPFAKRYFGEIMMPFKNKGKDSLDKIKDLNVEIIAPSHGPIHKNPEKIVEAYREWTSGETKEKAVVVYVSMWKSTESMIMTMAETLMSEEIEVCMYNLLEADVGDLAKDLVDSRAIVLGTPTVLGGMHPLALYALNLVKILRPPLKYGAVLSSYGWGGGALKNVQEVLGPSKIEIVGTLEIKGPPSTEDISKIIEMGGKLSDKIKEG